MKTRLLNILESLRNSFWLIPGLMVLASILLSAVVVGIDRATQIGEANDWGILYKGGAEGAGLILSTIASSMMTVAGVAFSIIIVALTLTSSQFGSRLLRNFVRDRGNQTVLGTFIATFTYCLLVLRSIYTAPGDVFVPSLSVTFAMALALINVGVLIYFIHHVSTSIQAERVTASVFEELKDRIETLFPDDYEEDEGQQAANDEAEGGQDLPLQQVRSRRSGYLQAVDLEGLLELAVEADLTFRIGQRPGAYIMPEGVLAEVLSERTIDDGTKERITGAFFLGTDRTPEQDAEFAVRQLVEIAVRALSPGINDPFTALTCIDQLGATLCILTGRTFPSPQRYDPEGKLRISMKALTFEGVIRTAFDQIRQYGRESVAVTIRLLEVLEQIAEQARAIRN